MYPCLARRLVPISPPFDSLPFSYRLPFSPAFSSLFLPLRFSLSTPVHLHSHRYAALLDVATCTHKLCYPIHDRDLKKRSKISKPRKARNLLFFFRFDRTRPSLLRLFMFKKNYFTIISVQCATWRCNFLCFGRMTMNSQRLLLVVKVTFASSIDH